MLINARTMEIIGDVEALLVSTCDLLFQIDQKQYDITDDTCKDVLTTIKQSLTDLLKRVKYIDQEF